MSQKLRRYHALDHSEESGEDLWITVKGLKESDHWITVSPVTVCVPTSKTVTSHLIRAFHAATLKVGNPNVIVIYKYRRGCSIEI